MANEFKVKKGLVVDGSGTVLDVQGTQGQLFSVTDSLTGDLFSVSDISGIPILNVNSSGVVDIDGNLTVSGTSSSLATGNTGTFVTNDGVSGGYPRLTLTNSSAQLGLFRSGNSGVYIGGSSSGFRIYSSSFSQKFQVDLSGNGTFAGTISASGYNDTNWNTAYGWGDHGLSAQDKTDIGNLSGTNTGDQTTITGNAATATNITSNLTQNFGLNDNKLFFRGYTDTNHYLWNNASDWEELVAYTGTGFKITSSTGYNMATFAGTGAVTFGGAVSASNLSNTNTGDQDLSSYYKSDNGTYTRTTGAHLSLKNTTNSGYSEFNMSNDVGHKLVIGSIGSTYSNTAWAGSRYIYSSAGELRIKAATNLRLYSGGTAVTDLAVTFDSSQNSTFTGSITATGGNSTEWNTAYDKTLQWDGSSTALVAATGRASLGLGTAATTASTDYATVAALSGNDRSYITDSRGAARAPSYYNDRYAQWDFQNASDTGVGGDTWHGLLTVAKWSVYDGSHRQEQLIFSGNDLFRRTASSDSAWGTSKKIYDSGNLTNVAKTNVANNFTQIQKTTLSEPKLQLQSNSSPSLMAGIHTQVGGQLLGYGTNFSQVGARNNSYPGAFFRIDVRSGYESQFFTVQKVTSTGTSPNVVTTEAVILAVNMDGDLTATGSLAENSDERLKSDIKTVDNALDKINALRGVTYIKNGKRGLGVIAQEVEKVLPEVVIDGAEYKSVAYGNIVSVLIEAVKEQDLKIERLEGLVELMLKDKQ